MTKNKKNNKRKWKKITKINPWKKREKKLKETKEKTRSKCVSVLRCVVRHLGRPGQRVPWCCGQRWSMSWVSAAPKEKSACTTLGVDGTDRYGTTGRADTSSSRHSSPTHPNSWRAARGVGREGEREMSFNCGSLGFM